MVEDLDKKKKQKKKIGERMAEIRKQTVGRKGNREERKECLAYERLKDSEHKRKKKRKIRNEKQNRTEEKIQRRIEQNRIEQRRNEGEEGSENCHLEGRR